jgi:hypothetical protein
MLRELGGGLHFDPQYDTSSLTLVTIGGNAAPPGGGARVNENHYFPAWDQPALSNLQGNSNDFAVGQAGAGSSTGNNAGSALDAFFLLMAERVGKDGKPWEV